MFAPSTRNREADELLLPLNSLFLRNRVSFFEAEGDQDGPSNEMNKRGCPEVPWPHIPDGSKT